MPNTLIITSEKNLEGWSQLKSLIVTLHRDTALSATLPKIDLVVLFALPIGFGLKPAVERLARDPKVRVVNLSGRVLELKESGEN